MVVFDYQYKYAKYKNKYTNLKTQAGGAKDRQFERDYQLLMNFFFPQADFDIIERGIKLVKEAKSIRKGGSIYLAVKMYLNEVKELMMNPPPSIIKVEERVMKKIDEHLELGQRRDKDTKHYLDKIKGLLDKLKKEVHKLNKKYPEEAARIVKMTDEEFDKMAMEDFSDATNTLLPKKKQQRTRSRKSDRSRIRLSNRKGIRGLRRMFRRDRS